MGLQRVNIVDVLRSPLEGSNTELECCADQDAKEQLERVIALEPANGHAWHTLGLLEEQQGNQQEALDCFSRGQQSDGVPFAHSCMHC